MACRALSGRLVRRSSAVVATARGLGPVSVSGKELETDICARGFSAAAVGRFHQGGQYDNLKNWKWYGGAAMLAAGAGSMVVRESCSEASGEVEVRDREDVAPASVDGKKKTNYILGGASDSYRRKVFFKYEKRLRLRSPPEKVFEYFSSIKDSEGQSFMTPGDFMRAVVPVFPPSSSAIIREGNLLGERSPGELFCPPSPFFMLFDTNGDGLISFPEYIFFVTLLSLPEKNFKAAFKMFDLNGNGCIDRTEFKEVMGVMRSHHRQGLAQRDGRRTGLTVPEAVENGGLVEFFFGADGTKQLRHEDFEHFLEKLHEEIIRLEFAHYDFEGKGTISARDFALSVVASADFAQLNSYLDRVDNMVYNPRFESVRITPEEFHNFAELRKKLPTLSVAINSFGKCHGFITKKDFQRAASQVCSVALSDALVDIIYFVFDLNRDGNLSMDEFLGVLHRRVTDVGNPSESGLVSLLKCWWDCSKACGTPMSEL